MFMSWYSRCLSRLNRLTYSLRQSSLTGLLVGQRSSPSRLNCPQSPHSSTQYLQKCTHPGNHKSQSTFRSIMCMCIYCSFLFCQHFYVQSPRIIIIKLLLAISVKYHKKSLWEFHVKQWSPKKICLVLRHPNLLWRPVRRVCTLTRQSSLPHISTNIVQFVLFFIL